MLGAGCVVLVDQVECLFGKFALLPNPDLADEYNDCGQKWDVCVR